MGQALDQRWRRAWRIARRSPATAIRSWKGAFLNDGQFIALGLAAFTSWIGLQTASIPEIFEEANAWQNALQAFAYVAVAWGGVCLVRAPFQVCSEDRLKGQWHGGRFLYHRPMLVKTLLCRPTGRQAMYEFEIPHVEPGSFVYCEVQLEPVLETTKITLGSRMFTGLMPYSAGRRIGFKLPKGSRSAVFMIEQSESAISATVRVFCKSFIVGPVDDKDGDAGKQRIPNTASRLGS